MKNFAHIFESYGGRSNHFFTEFYERYLGPIYSLNRKQGGFKHTLEVHNIKHGQRPWAKEQPIGTESLLELV